MVSQQPSALVSKLNKLLNTNFDFENWYEPDVFSYILPVKKESPFLHVIFHDADAAVGVNAANTRGTNTSTFKEQLQQLIMLGNRLEKPVLFIGKEPGGNNHFVCGLLKVNQLVLLNPLGTTTHADCYKVIKELKQDKILNQIWFSKNSLQRSDYEEGLVSCGPIALEFAIHVLSHFNLARFNHFWNQLPASEPSFNEKLGLNYFTCDLSSFLPETLKTLQTVKNKDHYKHQVCAIRQTHHQKLKALADQCQCAEKKGATDGIDYLNTPAQVVFNALITSHNILSIESLEEYIQLKAEPGSYSQPSRGEENQIHENVLSEPKDTPSAKRPSGWPIPQGSKNSRLTKGEGDCAFHAALGSWNVSTSCFEASELNEKRKGVAEAIKTCKRDSPLFPLIRQAITALAMGNVDIKGERYKQLKKAYKDYEKKDNGLITEKWGIFEKKLRDYPLVIQHVEKYIDEYIQDKGIGEPNLGRLRSQFLQRFSTCESQGDETLRALIMSHTGLETAYVDYKKPNHNLDLDQWIEDPGLLKEYAEFISIPGQWLLPCELNIIAHVFKISIEFYATKNAEPEWFNRGQEKQISVCFDGHVHYERMASEQEIKQWQEVNLIKVQAAEKGEQKIKLDSESLCDRGQTPSLAVLPKDNQFNLGKDKNIKNSNLSDLKQKERGFLEARHAAMEKFNTNKEDKKIKVEEEVTPGILSEKQDNALINNAKKENSRTGDAVKDTFHGTDYQINVLVLYAFNNFVSEKPFELRTEDKTYGKFDDVVLIKQDNIEVVQIKHSRDNDGKYSLNNFATNTGESKKVQFYNYFDSWFDHRENPQFICKIYTNHTVTDEEHGLDLCLHGFHFKREFINNSSPPIGSKKNIVKQRGNVRDEDKIKFCSDHIFRSIKFCSQKLKDPRLDEPKKNELIQRFLSTIELVLGQSSVQELSENIKSLFRTHFKTTNDAIYYEFYCKIKDWLRDTNVSSHDNQTIGQLFSEGTTNYIYLERLCGVTIQHLGGINKTLFNGVSIPRHQLKDLTSQIDDPSSAVLLLTGPKGIGKSSLIKQYHQDHRPVFLGGEFIFIGLSDMLNILDDDTLPHIPNFFRSCKIFCIDKFEAFTSLNKEERAQIIRFISLAIKKMRVVTLINEQQTEDILLAFKTGQIPYRNFSVNYLSKEQVLEQFPSFSPLFDATNVTIIKSNEAASSYGLILKRIPQCLAEDVSSITSFLLTPFYLNLILRSFPQKLVLMKINDYTSLQELSDYLILLSLKYTNGDYSDALFSKKLSILQWVVYRINSNSKIPKKFNDEALTSLIQDNIITGCQESGFTFAHILFEEFIVRQIIKSKLKEMEMSEEHPLKTLKFIIRHLSNHRYIWTHYLYNNKRLYEAIKAHYDLKTIPPLLKNNNFFLILYLEIMKGTITIKTVRQGLGYNPKFLLDVLEDSLIYCADFDPINTAAIIVFIEQDAALSQELISMLMKNTLASPLMVLCKHSQTFAISVNILFRHMSFWYSEEDCFDIPSNTNALYSTIELYGSRGPTFVPYDVRMSELRKFAFSDHDNAYMVAYLLETVADPYDAGSSYHGSKISRDFNDKNPGEGHGDDQNDENFSRQKLELLIAMHYCRIGDEEPILVGIFDSYLSLEDTAVCEFILDNATFEDTWPIRKSINKNYISPYTQILIPSSEKLPSKLLDWTVYFVPEPNEKKIMVTISHDSSYVEKFCLNDIVDNQDLIASLTFPEDDESETDSNEEILFAVLEHCNYKKEHRQAILALHDKVQSSPALNDLPILIETDPQNTQVLSL